MVLDVGVGITGPSRPAAVTVEHRKLAVIDGRIADVVASKVLDSQLVIPRFALAELQAIADLLAGELAQAALV